MAGNEETKLKPLDDDKLSPIYGAMNRLAEAMSHKTANSALVYAKVEEIAKKMEEAFNHVGYCTHLGYNYKKDGRRCKKCFTTMVDFGD